MKNTNNTSEISIQAFVKLTPNGRNLGLLKNNPEEILGLIQKTVTGVESGKGTHSCVNCGIILLSDYFPQGCPNCGVKQKVKTSGETGT